MNLDIKVEDNFRYFEIGKGSNTLILLHGLFGALSNFKDIIAYFQDNYRIIVPIFPLYDMPVKETTVNQLSFFLDEFIEFKKLKNFVLVGNSLGGHVGLVYTFNNQDKVKSLVLTGSSGLFEKAFGDSFPKRGDYNYIKQKTEETFYNPKTADKALVDEVFEIVNNREKALRVLSMARSAIKHNMASELPTIHVKVLLLWGKNDTITPPFVAEEFHHLLPNSELHFIDECGHAPMMEQPQQFNHILSVFLDKLS